MTGGLVVRDAMLAKLSSKASTSKRRREAKEEYRGWSMGDCCLEGDVHKLEVFLSHNGIRGWEDEFRSTDRKMAKDGVVAFGDAVR